MRHVRWPIGLAGLALLAVSLSWGSPTVVIPAQKFEVPPFAKRGLVVKFNANEPAKAICIGNGQSHLGIYVYDQHGNCVAREDVNQSNHPDDLAVMWYPESAGGYTVEVINFGKMPNLCRLAFK